MGKEIDERAFRLALRVVTLRTDDEYRRAARWTIVGQLIRASTSVGANLAEASVAQTKRDFVTKVSISRKEILETQYWLRLADETRLFGELDLTELRSEAASVGKVLSTIVRRAKASEGRGRD